MCSLTDLGSCNAIITYSDVYRLTRTLSYFRAGKAKPYNLFYQRNLELPIKPSIHTCLLVTLCVVIKFTSMKTLGEANSRKKMDCLVLQNIPSELWVEITIQLNQSRLSNNNRAQTV